MLQGGYPAKLKKVLIVTAPLWFKAPFKILRLFVREKLRDRVFTVSIPQVSMCWVRTNSYFDIQRLVFSAYCGAFFRRDEVTRTGDF